MEVEGDGEAGGKPRKGEKRFLKVKLLEWQQEEDVNFFFCNYKHSFCRLLI